MKKIIEGKKYDTDTSTLVAEWEADFLANDFNWYMEQLYKKRTGEYFVYGEGNGASRYARTVGLHGGTWGCTIIPVSYDDARAWLEEKGTVDEYEAEFGEVSEDDAESVVLSVRVSPAAKTALDRLAAQTGRSKGEIVTDALLALR